MEKDMLLRRTSVLSDKLKHAPAGHAENRGRSRTKSCGECSQYRQCRVKRKRAADCELSLNCLMGPDAHPATQEDFDMINMTLLATYVDRHPALSPICVPSLAPCSTPLK